MLSCIQFQNKPRTMFLKSLVVAALALSTVDAFMAPSALPMKLGRGTASASSSLSRVRCQEKGDEEEEVKPIATGGTDYSKVPKKEVTPFFLIPAGSVVGDGSMVGDKGFDPAGFATSQEKLKNFREAELKHGRLAMLAAVGWPVAEVLNKPISAALGLPVTLVTGETCANSYECAETLSRAPSVLNGGLDKISPLYWGAVIALSAAIEAYGQKINKRPNYLPGDLGFDPLGLYQKLDPPGKLNMQLKELNNGRLGEFTIVWSYILTCSPSLFLHEPCGYKTPA